jgi:hypothetical protein
MDHLSLSDKLLRASEHLLPVVVFCCDLAIWLLLLPGRVATGL